MPLDLARAHPPRIHRDDLVIKSGEARLPLGHDLGLKARLAVPRSLQLEFPIVFLKSQMVGKLGLQRSLQDCFGESAWCTRRRQSWAAAGVLSAVACAPVLALADDDHSGPAPPL